MPGNSNLHDSSRNKQDEFYTNLQLVEDELKHYRSHFQGAGGVGGLLYERRNGAIYIPCQDAFGNIMGYWDTNGVIVAEYTYDAFGRTISQTGSMANAFRHRFSTKYYDSETGFYYYGYRYYFPELRRRLSRDPLEEEGGNNLYCFCGNTALFQSDANGCLPSRNWGGSVIPSNGRFNDALGDFLNGGQSKSYDYIYPDSATERLLNNDKLSKLLDEFRRMSCASRNSKKTIRGTIRYTADIPRFIHDVWTFFGTYDNFGRRDSKNSAARDIGHEILGSFTGKYVITIDCSKCLKALDLEVENDMTIPSATRIPGTNISLIPFDLLKPIHTRFTYLIIEPIR